MNMNALLHSIFHQDVPPDPIPKHIPDESEIRWGKLKLEVIKRRAKELDINIDINERFKYDRHS